MILDAIIGAIFFVLEGFLGLLPSWDVSAISNFGPALGSSMATASMVFPVSTLGICLGVVLGTWLFIHGWKLVVYVYRLIPFKLT